MNASSLRAALALLLATFALNACATSDAYRAAEDAMDEGRYDAALQSYDRALETTYYPAEFERAAQRRCDALDKLVTPAITDARALPTWEERRDTLVALRERFANCQSPKGRQQVDTALNEEALTYWDAELAPMIEAGQRDDALVLARPTAELLPGIYEFWRRYTLLRAELHQEALQALEASTTELSRAFYQNLARLYAPDEGTIADDAALRTRFGTGFFALPLTALNVELAGEQSQQNAFCTALRDELQAGLTEPAASSPLRVALDIAQCNTSTSRVDETIVSREPYYEMRTVNERVCRSYTVPVTVQQPSRRVCSGAQRCYQTGRTQQTCFRDCSYVGGGSTTRNETRQRCQMEDVTRRVELWREVRTPGYRALRTMALQGQATITDERGQTTTVPVAFTTTLPSAVVPTGAVIDAPTIEVTRAELTTRILAELPTQLRTHYASNVLIPRQQANFARLSAEEKLDLAIALSLHNATEPLTAAGRAWLSELSGANELTLAALIGGAEDFHPTPYAPTITAPIFDYGRIPLDHPASIAIHGAAPFQVLFTGRVVNHDGFPTQAPRQGTLVHFGYRANMANGFLDRYLGWIYQDQLDLLFSIGARTSESQTVLDEVGESRREERGLAYGYRFSYTGMYGYRGPSLGTFVGLKLQRSGDRTGHIFTAGAAMPAVLQLELRHNPTYPVILQAWGGDLNLTRFNRTFGASLAIPAGVNRWFYASAERRRLRTQFYALTLDERVDAGIRPSWEFHLGMSFGIALGQ
ncbi:tetratricopeptide repeat protein [Lujinxingia vulgaris]|uniref:Tetratricopeptide repeat protein n=1 Tax=Lujinxingia vulgaris TaxID=2600176 RepID=A0A5C6XC55_9DELT|nr:tetratricopeptide repeat protein [Lujinxingia vulgaris]TXD37297.1 tetratricopeptide repeat protein [Lujinxingia vulgaris]